MRRERAQLHQRLRCIDQQRRARARGSPRRLPDLPQDRPDDDAVLGRDLAVEVGLNVADEQADRPAHADDRG